MADFSSDKIGVEITVFRTIKVFFTNATKAVSAAGFFRCIFFLSCAALLVVCFNAWFDFAGGGAG